MTEPIIIIGAGWAGLAAAVTLTQQGHTVHVFESAKQAGGRARTVSFDNIGVDNGQHLLIGAYTECLKLMKTVGINTNTALKRLPLLLTVIDTSNRKLTLQAPSLPAPLHLLYALVTARGLNLKDKIAAVKFGLYLKKKNYHFRQDISVKKLFKQTNQTEILIKQLWEPLCLATMNTPIAAASANIFMTVFKDAFTNKTKDADLLLPTTDLSNLFPNAAIEHIENNGGKVFLKSRIEQIEINNGAVTSITAKIDNKSQTIKASQVIISTAPQNIKKLLVEHSELSSLYNKIEQFKYEPIVTIYLQYTDETHLTQPMIGLSGTISQWAFDRGSITKQAGLISIVVSANGNHMDMDDDTLAETVHNEISILFSDKPILVKSFVIREKRATFASSVNINNIRPKNKTSVDGLFIAGDYTNTGYPATIEGAIRSGVAASNLIIDKRL